MVKCMEYGANLINDVSGFEYDKQSIKVKKIQYSKSITSYARYTKICKNPKYKNVLLDIYDFFEKKINHLNDRKLF